MTSADRSLVVARGTEQRSDWERSTRRLRRSLSAALEGHTDLSAMCAVLDDGMDHEEFVALVSVLVVRGVAAFDTSHPQIVQRTLDTHSAIAAGEIEVLNP